MLLACSFSDALELQWLAESHRRLRIPAMRSHWDARSRAYLLSVIPVVCTFLGLVLADETWAAIEPGIRTQVLQLHQPHAARGLSAGTAHAVQSALLSGAEADVLVELNNAVQNEQEKVASLQLQLDSERKRRRRWQESCTTARQQCAELVAAHEAKRLRAHDTAWFSVYAGMTLALRRCAANIGAERLSIALQTDISHQTVTKWEHACDAALVAASRSFYAEKHGVGMAADCMLSGGTPCFVIHHVRSDATNANVWQHSKLHCCEISSHYLEVPAEMRAEAVGADVLQHVESRRQLADLQVVLDSSGRGCLAMLGKQMENLGVPQWASLAGQYGLTCYATCTDAGPDPTFAMTAIRQEAGASE